MVEDVTWVVRVAWSREHGPDAEQRALRADEATSSASDGSGQLRRYTKTKKKK